MVRIRADAVIAHQKVNHDEVHGENMMNHKVAATRMGRERDFIVYNRLRDRPIINNTLNANWSWAVRSSRRAMAATPPRR